MHKFFPHKEAGMQYLPIGAVYKCKCDKYSYIFKRLWESSSKKTLKE
jgi:hypothetical protein